MARRKTPQQLRTGGFAWGNRRVELGVSMGELAKRAGVSKPVLSQIERGRMVPTGAEFRAVTEALDAIASDRAAAGESPAPTAAPFC